MPDCPPASELEDFAQGRLAPDRRQGLEAHLEECSRCRDLVIEREIELVLPATTSAAASTPAAQADLAPPPERGQQLGPYRILEELGRGGQARVYLAEDTRLPRRVALKVFQGGWTSSDNVLARFRREAAALSRLDHPGLCTVHETGVWNGLPYIAMRHVEGGSLSRWIASAAAAGTPPSPRAQLEMVELLERVARALHTAHQAGLVHRDVKPSNILLTREGEPVIVDFGLARDHESGEQSLTRTGDLPGTPAYMSPEQVRGERSAVDRRSDVFALGVTLYETLTLKLPFDAPTTAGVFQRILGGQWTPPSSAQRRLPRDLLVILATALEPDRDRRYQTALAFAEDLRRYRQHETILARPAGRSLRLRRWAQRNPVTAVSLGASFLILTTALAISLALLRRVQRESEARAAALRREEGTRLALQSASLLSTNPGQALLLALEAAERAPSLEANNALLRAVQSSRERARLFGHTGWVRQAAFAADGSRLATASRDRTARVWDVRTGRTLAIARGHTGQVWTAELSPDGERLLTAAEDRTARIWDARTGEERLRLIGHEHGVASARHSPDGSQILTVGHATARLWDAATAQARHVLAAHTGEIRKATFHPGGTRVATGSADRNAILWDAHTGQSLHVLAGHLAAVNDVRFSGDGKRLITGADDGGVRIWDADNGLLVVELKGHKHSIRAALLSSDGSMAATGSDDFKAVLWDVESGKARFELGHDSRVTSLELSPDGRLLLSASYDSKARVWGTRSGKLLRTFSGHSGIIIHAAFSPGCDLVATSSVDHTARIWSLHAEWPRNATSALAGNPESASLDPTGERVVAILASALNEAQVLRLEPDARPIKLAGHAGPITFLQFSPDGQSVLTTSQDATARLWSCADGALRRELLGHTGPVLRSSFSADGKRIATASEDRSVRLWDAGSGAELVRITGAQKPYHVASLSPDGAHVLCGARDSSLVLAAAGTGAVLRAFDPVEEHLLTAEWTPDGRRMVVADTTHRVKVWDPFDGASMATLVHPSRVILALPSPDGRWIATACQDLIVRLWDAHTLEETLHAQVDGTIGKELSFDGRGRWFAVYGFEVYTSQVSDGAQKGRLMLFPLDPRAEAERLRPGELTPDERDQYRVGSAEERARRRAAWQGGEVYGVRSVAPPER